MEKAEKKRIQNEVTAKEKAVQSALQGTLELSRERYEKRKAEKRESTARKKAGLLTPEELKADEQRRAKNREWQKNWRDKKAAELPKSSKPQPRNDNSMHSNDNLSAPASIYA